MEAKKLKIDASVGIDNMPDEVLVKIFSYFSLSVLKKARLVCSQWYEASKDVMILKHQNFVFTSINYDDDHEDEMEEMLSTLANGHLSYYNLRFIGAKLSNAFERFVSSHGAKIYSLSFERCKFPAKIIKNIMINCINLKELNFGWKKFNSGNTILQIPIDSGNNILRIPTDLQIPMANGQKIIREKLTTLKLLFKNDEFLSDLLLVFIGVYPSIKELYLTLTLQYCEYNYYKYESLIALKCYQIPKFCLQFPTGAFFEDCNRMFTDENLIAIRDRLSIGDPHVHIFQFAMHYGSIKELDVWEIKFENLPIILQNLPNLEHLKVRLFRNAGVTTDVTNVLKSIAESRLKSLSLCFPYFHISPEEISDDIPWMNQSMERFSYYGSKFHESDLVFHMLKMFPNLTSLFIRAGFNSEIVKRDVTSYIFERLVALKYLHLDVYCSGAFPTKVLTADSNYDSSFKNCNFFPNLEHLTLAIFEYSMKHYIEKFVNFPNLKFLILKQDCGLNENHIAKLIENLPYLEWLDISHISISNDTLFQIYDNLKYLRCLVLLSCEAQKERITSNKIIKMVLRRCPTLRILTATALPYNKWASRIPIESKFY